MKRLWPFALLMALWACPALADDTTAVFNPLQAIRSVTSEMKEDMIKGIPKLPHEIEKKEGLTLKDCIDIALSNHQRLASGYNSIAASLARVEAAQAPYYPTVTLNGEYTSNYAKVASFVPGHYEFYKAYGSLNQTLLDFGRRSNSLDAARSAVESEKAVLGTTRADVIYNVKEAYYQVLSAKQSAKANEEAVSLAEGNLNRATAQFEAGTNPKFDVTKAEVDLQNAKINLIKARYAVEGALMTLRNRIFVPYRTPVTLAEPAPLPPYEEDLDKLVSEAMEKRPEAKELEAKIKQAEFQLASVKSDFYPTLGVNANYGWQDYHSDLSSKDNYWNVVVALRMPLFEGFTTKARVSEDMANLNGLRAQLITMKQDIGLEVVKDYLSMQDAKARLSVTSETIRKTREQLEIAQGRYEAGVGILLEVTDARVALTQARTTDIQTQNEYFINRAKLDKAIGRE